MALRAGQTLHGALQDRKPPAPAPAVSPPLPSGEGTTAASSTEDVTPPVAATPSHGYRPPGAVTRGGIVQRGGRGSGMRMMSPIRGKGAIISQRNEQAPKLHEQQPADPGSGTESRTITGAEIVPGAAQGPVQGLGQGAIAGTGALSGSGQALTSGASGGQDQALGLGGSGGVGVGSIGMPGVMAGGGNVGGMGQTQPALRVAQTAPRVIQAVPRVAQAVPRVAQAAPQYVPASVGITNTIPTTGLGVAKTVSVATAGAATVVGGGGGGMVGTVRPAGVTGGMSSTVTATPVMAGAGAGFVVARTPTAGTAGTGAGTIGERLGVGARNSTVANAGTGTVAGPWTGAVAGVGAGSGGGVGIGEKSLEGVAGRGLGMPPPRPLVGQPKVVQSKPMNVMRPLHEVVAPPVEPEPKEAKLDGPMNGQRLNSLLREIEPGASLHPDTEELILAMLTDHLDSVNAHCIELARHRKSDLVEVKDLQMCLEKQWGMPWLGVGSPSSALSKQEAAKARAKLSAALATDRAGKGGGIGGGVGGSSSHKKKSYKRKQDPANQSVTKKTKKISPGGAGPGGVGAGIGGTTASQGVGVGAGVALPKMEGARTL